jgi:hypothetical protein
MNAVQDKNYPVPMYKPELPVNDKANAGPMNPTYAHNKKQEQALEADGWTSETRHLKFEFPFAMYDPNGNIVAALDEAHKNDLIAAGYSAGVIVKKAAVVREVPAPGTAAAAMAIPADDGRVDELETKIEELSQTIEEIKTDGAETKKSLAEILEAVTANSGSKKK